MAFQYIVFEESFRNHQLKCTVVQNVREITALNLLTYHRDLFSINDNDTPPIQWIHSFFPSLATGIDTWIDDDDLGNTGHRSRRAP